MTDKPVYRVPSMAEIRDLPWNGLNVVSTFSGAGGSCLGYRMAGYRVLWASEFIPAAQDVYRRNHPTSILDTRDIRTVDAEEILEATGLDAGELDLFDGSPPCASFSTAGKRDKGWGKTSTYSDTKQRTDDLFFEYARILEGLRPKTFVAENVSGLVKGKAKGYFKEILAELRSKGYRVQAKLLDAQWLGVPQARQRLIFVGVREDMPFDPVFPKPLPYRYTVRDALPWITEIEGATGFDGHAWQGTDQPMPTIMAARPVRVRTAKGDRSIDEPAPTVLTHGRAGTHSEMTLVSPTADELAAVNVDRYAIGPEAKRLERGETSRKYLSLVRTDPDRPSFTITATGGTLGAAGPVVVERAPRKFTIAELRRIQAFPDDFELIGTYAQQWERLGRSVPPVMMRHIAERIAKELA